MNSLKASTQEFIALNGFNTLSKIQQACIPKIIKGQDLLAIGATGTGKTHAYLIPIIEKIDVSNPNLQVIISAPTRELAYQIHKHASLMKKVYPELKIRLLVGGSDSQKLLHNFNAQIVVGTPGRLKAFYEANVLRLDTVRMMVIDEADMTLEFGFLDDVDTLLGRCERAQVLCFSATLPNELEQLINKYLDHPQLIRIEDEEELKPQIRHCLVDCKHRSYSEQLLEILPGFKPYVCLIFANTRLECDECYEALRQAGYQAIILHSGLSSRQRQQAMRALESHEYSYVIASDMVARGIDIEGVSHVVSLGFPQELAFYMHRSGRTGRSGREGTCFALYKESDKTAIKNLIKQGINFERVAYKNGSWKLLNELKRTKKAKEKDPEVLKILKKKEKVKPNYKKKKREAILKLERQKRRDFIRKKIKEENKERYRQAAKERGVTKRDY